ncbi:hypothetical protein OnM2_018038 [Erysiphe neolycopersici]|uniref:Uncharacterized protein n=1 Tax=Erysiphe neolycopersici TaxID=212602 RepID=A0A420I486_9PEZI|nr:hypothetical protein OnM2_018038 [Erysiphe neolycopersici]
MTALQMDGLYVPTFKDISVGALKMDESSITSQNLIAVAKRKPPFLFKATLQDDLFKVSNEISQANMDTQFSFAAHQSASTMILTCSDEISRLQSYNAELYVAFSIRLR